MVNNIALGSYDGECTLYSWTKANQGVASLVNQEGFDEIFNCPVLTLDRYLDNLSLPTVDILKIDTEGADLSVLRGGSRTIAKYKPSIYIEVCTAVLEKFDATPLDILRFLQDLDYDVWCACRTRRGSVRLMPVTDHRVSSLHMLESWLAVHPGRVSVSSGNAALAFGATT